MRISYGKGVDMFIRAMSGSGGGGASSYKMQKGNMSANQTLRFKTTNCTFVSFNSNDTSDAWDSPVRTCSFWCGVYEGNFTTSVWSGYFTTSYSDGVLTITMGSDGRWGRYFITGEFEEVT